MAYMLSGNLWCCRIGGHLLFLDVEEDRYFQVPPSKERSIIARLDAAKNPGQRICDDHGDSNASTTVQAHNLTPVTRSVIEESTAQAATVPLPALRVSAVVLATLWRLELHSLRSALDHMCRYRTAHATAIAGRDEAAIIDLSRSFNRARLLVPMRTTCLLDSLALAVFLAKNGHRATVVMGVTCNPFSAHSWVQTGDIVLNDSVGNINSYTPIGIF